MSNKTIKCEINGQPVEVKTGASIIHAFKKLDQPIAHYCWHPGLSVAGVCRLCMVEIEGIPKLQIACNTEAKEGMKISNQSEKVKSAVRWGLEFHLINHPLDCPICDQAGECELQEQYMRFGQYSPNMAEKKVKKRKVIDLGSKIVLDSERCILCTRCTRFTDEVSKTHELGIFNRGDRSEIGIFKDKPLENNYAVNTVDICPVGALTSKDFRFRQRVWYLKTANSICTGCSTGCNITVDYNEEGVFRVKPLYNQEINKHWMCDKGRKLAPLSNREGRLLQALAPSFSKEEINSVSQFPAPEKEMLPPSTPEKEMLSPSAPEKEMLPPSTPEKEIPTAHTHKQKTAINKASDSSKSFLGGGAKQHLFNPSERADSIEFLKNIKKLFIENNNQTKNGKPKKNARHGLILTAQYTTEEYKTLIAFFLNFLGTKKSIYYWQNNPKSFNEFDGLLFRGDKNPNTKGLGQVLEKNQALNPWENLQTKLKNKEIDTLWVTGPENQTAYPDLKEKIENFEKQCPNIIWWTAHPLPVRNLQNTWQIPTKTCIEKEGTLTNFAGIKQKIKPVCLFVSSALSLSESVTVLKGEELKAPESFLGTMKTNYFTERRKAL